MRKQVPAPGRLGVFDRSHYEDVLVVRVEGLVPERTWRTRYRTINRFEAELTDQGVTIVKCFLHISPVEQTERLLARLDDPTKHWKYNPADIDARSKWFDYQAAYAEALQRCSTDVAPWYVIPADRKWYRNWVVANLLIETLEELDPQFPKADFDVDAETRPRGCQYPGMRCAAVAATATVLLLAGCAGGRPHRPRLRRPRRRWAGPLRPPPCASATRTRAARCNGCSRSSAPARSSAPG